MKHSINIYPDEIKTIELINEKPTKIFFGSKAEKEEYRKKEWNFTKKEYDKYIISNGKKVKQLMLERRVLFARQQNYGPKPNDKYTWVKQYVAQDKILA